VPKPGLYEYNILEAIGGRDRGLEWLENQMVKIFLTETDWVTVHLNDKGLVEVMAAGSSSPKICIRPIVSNLIQLQLMER